MGYSPVARHYWGNHILFSLPAGTKMFQFPAFAPHSVRWQSVRLPGCPIRTPMDQGSLAPPPGFSQRAASFFAFRSQGIRRAPFLAFAALSIPGESTYLGTTEHFCSLVFFSFSMFQELFVLLEFCLKKSSSLFCSTMSMTDRAISCRLVENNGFEPLTPCVQSRCSSQLS